MPRILTTPISGSQCIGDSLPIINDNYEALDTVVYALSTNTIAVSSTATITPTLLNSTTSFPWTKTLAANVNDNSITSSKLAANSVTNTKLDISVIRNQGSVSSPINSNSELLIWDFNTNSLKKIMLNQIYNVPYLEYAQVCAPNATRQAITGDSAPTTLLLGTRVLDQNNIAIAFDTTTVTVPSGTYQYEATSILNSGGTNFTSILYLSGGANIISRSHYGTQSNASGNSEFRNLLTGQVTLSASTALSIACTTSINASVGPTDLPTVSTATNDQRTTLKLWKIG